MTVKAGRKPAARKPAARCARRRRSYAHTALFRAMHVLVALEAGEITEERALALIKELPEFRQALKARGYES